METIHFTQMIWADTRYIGCGLNYCPEAVDGYMLICNYYPSGNMEGESAYLVSEPCDLCQTETETENESDDLCFESLCRFCIDPNLPNQQANGGGVYCGNGLELDEYDLRQRTAVVIDNGDNGNGGNGNGEENDSTAMPSFSPTTVTATATATASASNSSTVSSSSPTPTPTATLSTSMFSSTTTSYLETTSMTTTTELEVEVENGVCGNGKCEFGEDCLNCRRDCNGKVATYDENERYCCIGVEYINGDEFEHAARLYTTDCIGGNCKEDTCDPQNRIEKSYSVEIFLF